MASVFGDESADETMQRVFAVAGLIGNDEQWDGLKANWVKRTGGIIFHAAQCESDKGDFKQYSHRENMALYADLASIIAQSGVRGYGAVLDLAAWREFSQSQRQDFAYYDCFMSVLLHFTNDPSYLDGDDDRMEFTFDHRQESEYNAGLLYSAVVNIPEWRDNNLLLESKVNFDSRKDVRIQAADLVAREAMKHWDNIVGPIKRPVRRSMQALLDSGRFQFNVSSREYWKYMHDKANELTARLGLGENDYVDWLEKHRLIDNWSNRIRFIIWFGARDFAMRELIEGDDEINSIDIEHGSDGMTLDKHVYWGVECTTRDCGSWVPVKYVGPHDGRPVYLLPSPMPKWIDLECDHCGKVHRYTRQQLQLEQLDEPPSLDFADCF